MNKSFMVRKVPLATREREEVIIVYFYGYVYRLIIIAHVDARENWLNIIASMLEYTR